MVFFFMDWKVVDGCLIRRGELLLSLDFLDGYDEVLEVMNRKKVGRPYRLVPRLPSEDYSGLRRRILRLDLSPYGRLQAVDEPLVITVLYWC